MAHGLPVLWPDPARLGLPVRGYQQQVARLHRVLVEQHHMACAEPVHLQSPFPGQEGVGFGAALAQMLGRGTQEAAQDKWPDLRQLQQLGGQGHQGASQLGLSRALQRPPPQELRAHRP